MRISILPIAAISFALVACGSDGPSPEFVAAAPGAAEAALITLDDLPAGWSVAPPDEDEDEDFDLELSDRCEDAYHEDATFSNELAEAASDEFVNADDDSISSEVAVFPNHGTAADTWDTLVADFDECADDVAFALEQYLKRVADESNPPEIADALDVDASFVSLDDPQLGDSSAHWRMSFDMNILGVERRFVTDSYLVLQGGMMGFVAYGTEDGSDPDQGELERLTELMLDRMDAAYATLP